MAARYARASKRTKGTRNDRPVSQHTPTLSGLRTATSRATATRLSRSISMPFIASFTMPAPANATTAVPTAASTPMRRLNRATRSAAPIPAHSTASH